jgi:hypothetical protein
MLIFNGLASWSSSKLNPFFVNVTMPHLAMKQNHTPILHGRSFTGHAVFSQGFRPFFLLAGIWAIVALALSFGMFRGWIALPTAFGVALSG